MQLYSDGVYKIFEPKVKKTFLIWSIILGAFGMLIYLITQLNPFVLLVTALVILIIFVSIISGNSQEYEFKDRKIYYKKNIVFRSFLSGWKFPLITQAPDDTLEVSHTVSALCNFRFEQTQAEKKRNMGRIYFCGTTDIAAQRPFTEYEKRTIPRPRSYVLYGVRNFENVKKELLAQLQAERENKSV